MCAAVYPIKRINWPQAVAAAGQGRDPASALSYVFEVDNPEEVAVHNGFVKVRYAGAGKFEVAGTSRQPGAVRDVVERFRNDMAPLVLKIGVDVEHTDELAMAGKADSALSADSVRYIESSDGTKHFLADASGTTTLH